jgi:3-hydroxybutyryl-CoA dehydrogenase
MNSALIPPLPATGIVAVIGTGAMGAGIAQVAAAAGHTVKLLDAREGAAARAVDGLRAQFGKLADKGRMDAAAAQAAGQRLIAVNAMAELADAALAIEAIVENLDAKQQLFAELESLVGDDCLLATNTSSISITAIGSKLRRPERLAGLHFFNPAPLMALVEVVSGLATARAVADTLFATAEAWGKVPVYAASTPGFIVNRVARPYYAEALRLAQEGAADYATIDAVMREAGGFRMGPFQLMDMIGHDVNFAVTRSVWSAFYYDQRFLPSLLQQELVDGGFLGKKSGRGFYDYRDGAPAAPVSTEAPLPVPASIGICGDSAAARALAQRLGQAGVAFSTADSANGCIATTTDAVLFVTDGRSATRRAADLGLANVVLIDLAIDYTSAGRIAVAGAAQCSAAAVQQAIALLQAAGLQVSRFSDVPGLAVMRTVAMLANEAADAVNQGVCSAAAADAAMKLGVNYPQGPLAWADALGVPTVHSVLAHLGASYGEDRYRISPVLQQAYFAGRSIHD